jgi:transposase
MKKRRSFSREFKREAAGMVLDQGFSCREVCRQLDLGETGLRRWVEQLQIEQAQLLATQWLWRYNNERPNSCCWIKWLSL